MAKSIIVYGVPGGKTRFAQRMRDHFGLSAVVSQWNGYFTAENGVLYLTSGFNFGDFDSPARSFQEVADEINASIPLTDWQSGPPPMVGEWETRKKGFTEGDTQVMRWWDSRRWSIFYTKDEPQHQQNGSAGHPSWFGNNDLEWRGLSQEPIKVTE